MGNNIVYDVDLKINKESLRADLEEATEWFEEVKTIADEIDIPLLRPIINFYGCSFNLGDSSSAESRYIVGNEEYNH